MNETKTQKLTPPQLARLWGISPEVVLTWIRNKELRAINVSSTMKQSRPRYRIDVADIEAFEKRREVAGTVSKPKVTERQDFGFKDFFPERTRHATDAQSTHRAKAKVPDV